MPEHKSAQLAKEVLLGPQARVVGGDRPISQAERADWVSELAERQAALSEDIANSEKALKNARESRDKARIRAKKLNDLSMRKGGETSKKLADQLEEAARVFGEAHDRWKDAQREDEGLTRTQYCVWTQLTYPNTQGTRVGRLLELLEGGEDELTAAQVAAENGHRDFLEWISTREGGKEKILRVGKRGTLLHVVMQSFQDHPSTTPPQKYFNTMDWLVNQLGVRLDGQDINGQTIAHMACYWSVTYPVLEWILKKKDGWLVAAKKNKEGLLPMHIAACRGHWNHLDLLVAGAGNSERGLPIESPDSSFAYTIAHFAVHWNRIGVLKWIVRQKAGWNVLKMRDKYGRDAMAVAVSAVEEGRPGSNKVLDWLVANGTPTNGITFSRLAKMHSQYSYQTKKRRAGQPEGAGAQFAMMAIAFSMVAPPPPSSPRAKEAGGPTTSAGAATGGSAAASTAASSGPSAAGFGF